MFGADDAGEEFTMGCNEKPCGTFSVVQSLYSDPGVIASADGRHLAEAVPMTCSTACGSPTSAVPAIFGPYPPRRRRRGTSHTSRSTSPAERPSAGVLLLPLLREPRVELVGGHSNT